MRLRMHVIAFTFAIGVLLAAQASAASFFFSTTPPDGRLGALSRPASPGKIETETADDFLLEQTTAITGAAIVGLIPSGTPLGNIGQIEIEIYHIFPEDSVTPPSTNVPTRTNSPSDVEIDGATRDSSRGTLRFGTTLVNASFSVSNTVVNGINKVPTQNTHGEGAAAGQEILVDIDFTTPIILPPGHYFFRPEVLVTGGNFLYLSTVKHVGTFPGTNTTDLQAWIRNSDLKPDWLRIGADIIGGTAFDMSFSLTGDTIPDAGTPGEANCQGTTISALARQFEGTSDAASSLGSSVQALHRAVGLFCKP